MNLISRARHVLADDTGGVVAEYGLILGGVVTITLAAIAGLTTSTNTLMTSVNTKITAAAK
ncbi:hypothetical protein V5F50_19805 [Xanthobacter sp. V13C-7B]|uniref:Flp family type IVb pilin n=1 Tax=Xanthobacter variabilis TaxID=3119932 RepID=UPI00372757AD